MIYSRQNLGCTKAVKNIFSKNYFSEASRNVDAVSNVKAGASTRALLEETRRAQASWSPIQLSALSSSLVKLTEDQFQVNAKIKN